MRAFELGSLLLRTLREFRKDHPLQLSAALSYYTLLALAPLVLVTVALCGLIFGREAVQGRIVDEMRGLVGQAGAEVIQTVIQNANQPKTGALSLAIGIVTLIVGATTVFVQLQDALNFIWDVEADPRKSALWGFVRNRLLSLAMILGVGFLLLVSLLLDAAFSALGGWAGGYLGDLHGIVRAANSVVSFGVITLLFAMIFKMLPDVKLVWRDVWFGAAVTGALFTLGKHLIGFYLGRVSIGSAYGAAGSVIVLMVWVYYAALIVLFGAELTRTRSLDRRDRVPADEHAERVPPPNR
jgi:membrane protein